jgi:hypothetical protein
VYSNNLPLGRPSLTVVTIHHVAALKANNISAYTDRAKYALGMYAEGKNYESENGGADIMGQGTWRVNSERKEWAVWSNPVVSEDVHGALLPPCCLVESSRV